MVVLEEVIPVDEERRADAEARRATGPCGSASTAARSPAFVAPRRRAGGRRPAAVPLLRPPARPRRPRLPPHELSARWTRLAAGCCRTARSRSIGRMPWSSNATFLCERAADGDEARGRSTSPSGASGRCGTSRPGLDRREVAAYELSEALGWDLVPPTILRGTARSARARCSCSSTPTSSSTTSRSTRTRPTTTTSSAPMCAFDLLGQQHRPQERPLPARARRPHLRHRPRPVLPPGVQAAHGDLGVRRRAGAGRRPAGRRPGGRLRTARGGDPPRRRGGGRAAAAGGDARGRGSFPIDTSGHRYPWPLV